MHIQWFPGHMLETEKLLKNAIYRTDAVLEVLDARCPDSSSNPLLDKLCKTVFRLKVLNKADLADKTATELWVNYFFDKQQTAAVAICGSIRKDAIKALECCVNHIKRNRARKLKVLVVGIPNTGKSTLINTLVGKKVAKTGNVPAVTRHQQRTSLPDNIDIYDTPGILWPVIKPPVKAFRLAASGAISDTAIDYSQIGYFACEFLITAYPDLLCSRYPFLNPLSSDPMKVLEAIGQAKGCLKKGGIVDIQKASEALIRELRAGKIGDISFETPKDLIYDTEQ